MAGVFVKRTCRLPPSFKHTQRLCAQQNLHATAIVRKKKRQPRDAFPDDLFGDSAETTFEERVPTPVASTSTVPVDESVITLTKAELRANRRVRELNNRLEQFNDLYTFVSLHIGRRPAAKDAQVRNSAWSQLFGLATSREQLEKVVGLMPKWKDGRREFSSNNSEIFVKRCDELHCPDLALKVFGDHSKYSLTLTQSGALQLLFSLHSRYSLSETIAASALWRVYNLPPIHSDPVPCAILAAACLKDDTPQSRVVGFAMLERLKGIVPQDQKLPPKELNDLPRIWLEKALAKVDRMIDSMENAEQLQWVRNWRAKNGFIQGLV